LADQLGSAEEAKQALGADSERRDVVYRKPGWSILQSTLVTTAAIFFSFTFLAAALSGVIA
jgi:hypothetical protein